VPVKAQPARENAVFGLADREKFLWPLRLSLSYHPVIFSVPFVF
jgi:hypothetical protein